MKLTIIVVNTPDAEFEFNATGLDLNKALEGVNKLYPDWTSLMVIYVRE